MISYLLIKAKLISITHAAVELIAPFPGSGSKVSDSTEYIQRIYIFAIGFGALLAMGIIIFGALRYMTEGGNSFKQSEAKAWIFSGVLGLIVLIGAVLILGTLNSNLSTINSPAQVIEEAEEEIRRRQSLDRSWNGRNAAIEEIEAASLTPGGVIVSTERMAEKITEMEKEFRFAQDIEAQRGLIWAREDLFEKYPDLKEDYFATKAKNAWDTRDNNSSSYGQNLETFVDENHWVGLGYGNFLEEYAYNRSLERTADIISTIKYDFNNDGELVTTEQNVDEAVTAALNLINSNGTFTYSDDGGYWTTGGDNGTREGFINRVIHDAKSYPEFYDLFMARSEEWPRWLTDPENRRYRDALQNKEPIKVIRSNGY